MRPSGVRERWCRPGITRGDAYGPICFFNDPERLRAIVTRLTTRQEAARAQPWAVTDAPEDFVQVMLKAIIGFAIPITRLEGKRKISQNRPAEDVAGVITGLDAEGRPDAAREVALANPGVATPVTGRS